MVEIIDEKRNIYDIINIIFVFLLLVSMSLSAIFLIDSLIVLVINIVISVIFTISTFSFWFMRNPFYSHLEKAMSISNFLFLFIKVPVLYYNLINTQHNIPSIYGLLFLLFPPSVIFFIIAFRFSKTTSISTSYTHFPIYKMRNPINIEVYSKTTVFRDDLEERKRQEDLIKTMKIKYKHKLIIILACIFSLSYFLTIFF
jgi:hypothetical protein